MKTIKKLDSTGDTAIAFDPEATDEQSKTATAEAKALFEQLTGKGAGYTAFDRSAGPDAPSARVDHFDALGSETVLVPRIVGG